MLKTVEALAQRAGALVDEVEAACPAAYRVAGEHGPAGDAWQRVLSCALRARLALVELGAQLAAKAGGDGAGAQATRDTIEGKLSALGAGGAEPAEAGGWGVLLESSPVRDVSPVLMREWVIRWMGTPPALIPPEDVPSRAAAEWLRWANENADEFFADLGKMASEQVKAGVASGGTTAGDGRSIVDLLKRYCAEMEHEVDEDLLRAAAEEDLAGFRPPGRGSVNRPTPGEG